MENVQQPVSYSLEDLFLDPWILITVRLPWCQEAEVYEVLNLEVHSWRCQSLDTVFKITDHSDESRPKLHNQQQALNLPRWGSRYHNTRISHPQFSSVTQLCPNLWDPMDCSTQGFLVHHLLQLAQAHAHWVSDAIQPSHPLPSLFSSSVLLPSIFCSIRVFLTSQVFASGGQVLELQLQYQSIQWIFRTDFL